MLQMGEKSEFLYKNKKQRNQTKKEKFFLCDFNLIDDGEKRTIKMKK